MPFPKKIIKKILRPIRKNYFEEFEMESKFEIDSINSSLIKKKHFRIIDSSINKLK